jgi:hypothetical protein
MSITHFGSAHRPVDGVDICRELYDYAVSSTLHPCAPFFSWPEASGQRQVLTYAVIKLQHQAVKAAALRLGVDPAKFNSHSLRIGGACAFWAAGVPLSMILVEVSTPGVLSIADVELSHTRFTQSVKYSDTCGLRIL